MATVNWWEATPWETFCAAAISAATASQLSKHHWSRSAEPSAEHCASSASALAARRRAHAAFSTRAHAPTPATPTVGAAAAASDSNIDSTLFQPPTGPPHPQPQPVNQNEFG